VKWFAAIMLLVAIPVPPTPVLPTKYICVRWAWSGDVFNRVVYCLKWEKVDK